MSKYLTSDNKQVEVLGVICKNCKTNEDRFICRDCGKETVHGDYLKEEKK